MQLCKNNPLFTYMVRTAAVPGFWNGRAQVERRGASYRGADGVEIGEGVSPHNALSEKFPTFWLGLVHLAFIRISDAISQFTRPDYSRSKEKKSPAIQG